MLMEICQVRINQNSKVLLYYHFYTGKSLLKLFNLALQWPNKIGKSTLVQLACIGAK
jgi:hypothetical protein